MTILAKGGVDVSGDEVVLWLEEEQEVVHGAVEPTFQVDEVIDVEDMLLNYSQILILYLG